MKKLQLLALCAVAGLLAACGGGQKYDLGYKLEAGKTYTQKMSMDMVIAQGGAETKVTMDMGYNFNVADTTGGKFTSNMSYGNLGMKVVTPMGEMAFSSEDTTSTPMPGMPFNMNKMFCAMKGIPLTVVMTKQGKVESISGVGALMDTVVSSLKLTDEVAAQAKAAMSQNFSEEKMKEQMQNMAIFPDHSVAIGDKWEGSVKTDMMDMKTTYTLKSATDTEVVIEGNSTLKLTASGMTLDGTQTSTVNVDRTSGWIKSGNTKQELKGSGMSMTTTVTISE